MTKHKEMWPYAYREVPYTCGFMTRQTIALHVRTARRAGDKVIRTADGITIGTLFVLRPGRSRMRVVVKPKPPTWWQRIERWFYRVEA